MERVTSPDLARYGAAFLAAFLAGGINSVAGGGSLISFPTLMWLGLPSVAANATNTVAIWPGTLGSIWGFRRELARTDKKMFWLAVPSLIGGGIGALLLRSTPPGVFDRLVPFLILFATALFSLQGPINRKLAHLRETVHSSPGWFAGTLLLQIIVGTYGGYFGAGMGIMSLTVLSLAGMSDILEMSGLTSLFGMCANATAALLFIWANMISWQFVLVMAVGSILGGYGAAGVARRIGKQAVRRFVIAVGFTIATALFIRILR